MGALILSLFTLTGIQGIKILKNEQSSTQVLGDTTAIGGTVPAIAGGIPCAVINNWQQTYCRTGIGLTPTYVYVTPTNFPRVSPTATPSVCNYIPTLISSNVCKYDSALFTTAKYQCSNGVTFTVGDSALVNCFTKDYLYSQAKNRCFAEVCARLTPTPTAIPTTRLITAIPTPSPIPTTKLITAVPTPTITLKTTTLIPQGLFTTNAQGTITHHYTRQGTTSWYDLYLTSVRFSGLKPSTQYQIYSCDSANSTNCSSHANAYFTSDSSGNYNSFSPFLLSSFSSTQLNRDFRLYQPLPVGAPVPTSSTSTCFMYSSSSTPCLKGVFTN